MNSLFSPPERTHGFFCVGDLFHVGGCRKKYTSDAVRALGQGIYPYVTTSASNNGICGLFGVATEEPNVITIDSATVGSAFYQCFPFTGSDHVEKLTPLTTADGTSLFQLTENIGLFICALLKKEMFRYSYGRKFNQGRIRNTCLPLPIKTGVPQNPSGYKTSDIDWTYIEQYVQQRRKVCHKNLTFSLENIAVQSRTAKEFFE